jgi:hypothetical protein
MRLRDPRFNVDDDGELSNLATIASNHGRGYMRESVS